MQRMFEKEDSGQVIYQYRKDNGLPSVFARAFEESKRYGFSEVTMLHVGIYVKKDAEDFVDACRKNGIGSFVYACKSTSALDDIAALIEAGAEFDSFIKIEAAYKGKRKKCVNTTYNGARFTV